MSGDLFPLALIEAQAPGKIAAVIERRARQARDEIKTAASHARRCIGQRYRRAAEALKQ